MRNEFIFYQSFRITEPVHQYGSQQKQFSVTENRLKLSVSSFHLSSQLPHNWERAQSRFYKIHRIVSGGRLRRRSSRAMRVIAAVSFVIALCGSVDAQSPSAKRGEARSFSDRFAVKVRSLWHLADTWLQS
jgi:hypothetical protein